MFTLPSMSERGKTKSRRKPGTPSPENPCIKVWLWEDAPERFRKVASKTKQPTWIALVPPSLNNLASVAMGPAGWLYAYKVPEGLVWAHYPETKNDDNGGF